MDLYHLASKRKRSNSLKPLFIFCGVVLLVVIVVLVVRFASPYKEKKMASGVFSFTTFANSLFGHTHGLFQSKKSLLLDNAILLQKTKVLEQSVYSVVALEQENTELKSIMGRVSDINSVVLSRVVSRPQATPYDTLIIDRGSDSGIEQGNIVLADGVYAIGRVVDVTNTKATVSLFTTPGEKTFATLANANLSVTLVGRGGGNFSLTLPREIGVIVDDYVILFDERAYIVGEVLKELSDPRDSIKSIILRSPINYWQLSWVQVLTEQTRSTAQ
ncbi:MAG: hypothetical protein KBB88_02165 [Candidatus Pacebacteria bacterium]|nr:hypothetical protein [Candidatus Paceibacterota bacterium]